MQMSESKENILPALVAAQAAIGSRVAKDAKNPHFRSDYATLQQVLGQITPHLHEHGLWLTQDVRGAQGGVEVITHIVHSSGEWAEFEPLYVPAGKNDAQGYGSAITYARRYALMPIFGLAPADDDGNAAVASTPQTIDEQTAAEIRQRLETLGVDQTRVLQYLGVPSLDSMPVSVIAKARAALDAKERKKAAEAESAEEAVESEATEEASA